MKKILFISGAVGLGHVSRDLLIVKKLREHMPDLEVFWLAEEPGSKVIEAAGETLLPESKLLYDSNSVLEKSVCNYNVNLVRWVFNVKKGWSKNGAIYTNIVEKYGFDLWIGDEPYDLLIEIKKNTALKKFPFVVIFDVLGLETMTKNPLDIITAYLINRLWSNFLTAKPPLVDKSLFIGEQEDVPDKTFGLMLPNRRKLAMQTIDFVGYALPQDITKYIQKTETRRMLDYREEPLVICTIGGTTAGKDLLDLCIKAYPLAKQKIPNLKMLLITGPRLSTENFQLPDGIKVTGYVPNLYRHLGAADLAIVSGGGTVTLELTALEKPFLYFPLEQHYEQQCIVSSRCQRHNAGVKMRLSETTPELLAEAVVANISKPVQYTAIPMEGAENAAKIIQDLLNFRAV
jgi:UDP-N-acetylglucosamine:LPS N-acetylglucosamine transferase